jgi:hypothetical protein
VKRISAPEELQVTRLKMEMYQLFGLPIQHVPYGIEILMLGPDRRSIFEHAALDRLPAGWGHP